MTTPSQVGSPDQPQTPATFGNDFADSRPGSVCLAQWTQGLLLMQRQKLEISGKMKNHIKKTYQEKNSELKGKTLSYIYFC